MSILSYIELFDAVVLVFTVLDDGAVSAGACTVSHAPSSQRESSYLQLFFRTLINIMSLCSS